MSDVEYRRIPMLEQQAKYYDEVCSQIDSVEALFANACMKLMLLSLYASVTVNDVERTKEGDRVTVGLDSNKAQRLAADVAELTSPVLVLTDTELLIPAARHHLQQVPEAAGPVAHLTPSLSTSSKVADRQHRSALHRFTTGEANVLVTTPRWLRIGDDLSATGTAVILYRSWNPHVLAWAMRTLPGGCPVVAYASEGTIDVHQPFGTDSFPVAVSNENLADFLRGRPLEGG